MFTTAVLGTPHVREINGHILSPDDGLLLGNGDLSCSLYQDANSLVFRLGKGDVWDRRMDFTGVPKPVTIREFIDGVLKEGWSALNWNASKFGGTNQITSAERMHEIFRGPTPIGKNPFPMPKPTGEFRLRIPVDLPGPMKITQRLVIEEARLEVQLAWANGVTMDVEALIPPDENVLSVAWKLNGWNDSTRVLINTAPVGLQLTRWADPDRVEWGNRYFTSFPRWVTKMTWPNSEAQPLPPPTTDLSGQYAAIEQRFYPDKTFPDGFRYRLYLMPGPGCGKTSALDLGPVKDAWLVNMTYSSTNSLRGEAAVAVTTSRDRSLTPAPKKSHDAYRAATLAAAKEYWTKSGVVFPDDKFLEDLWYATYHARRCILKGGTVPPGLFLPSTISDYSRWCGDWHANYNMQSIYWGDFTANRLDNAEAFFSCVDFFVPIGRKIAKEYYGCRGIFFQLEGFPVEAEDDHHGTLPLGRMAYMTGWMMTRYWEYYQYTRDKAWLAQKGYPMIKDCALFYLDFLKKAPHPDLPSNLNDGKYHAFPSVAGESGFKKPMDLCDQSQVIRHARYCLWAAVEASQALGIDESLRTEWKDRLDNLAHNNASKLEPYNRHCYLCCPPEHNSTGIPYKEPEWDWQGDPYVRHSNDLRYLGITHWWKIGNVRGAGTTFKPSRDFPAWRATLETWTRPNGLVMGMNIQEYGRVAWTESLSCMAPFQEMMLQSWDGAIRLFPCWPRDRDAAFNGWRAHGAFIVSAMFKDGKISDVRIESEKGEDCLVHGNWTVTSANGEKVKTDRDEFGRLRFKTTAGIVYKLSE
jgi:hypothetical protein